ncbi:MAG: hypothetical protein WC383_11420 [Gammaproteobacteria bacterium]
MTDPTDAYITAFKGSFISALRWHQLDELWNTLRGMAGSGWHIYAIGETPPHAPATAEQVNAFITEIDALLRREHDEDYCGIVYADNFKSPTIIKIYDPNNLGSVCGSSANPPLPGWVLSLLPPVDLKAALPPPMNRRRWWQRLFGAGGS